MKSKFIVTDIGSSLEVRMREGSALPLVFAVEKAETRALPLPIFDAVIADAARRRLAFHSARAAIDSAAGARRTELETFAWMMAENLATAVARICLVFENFDPNQKDELDG